MLVILEGITMSPFAYVPANAPSPIVFTEVGIAKFSGMGFAAG